MGRNKSHHGFASYSVSGELLWSDASSVKEHFIAETYYSVQDWDEDAREKIRKDWPDIENVTIEKKIFANIENADNYCEQHKLIVL